MLYVDKPAYTGEAILLPRKGTLDAIMYVNGSFWTVDTIYWATVDNQKAYAKYLYSYLCLLDLSHKNQGTAVPSLTFESWYSIKIDLPSLEEQKRIGDLAFTFIEKMETNRKMVRITEDLLQFLYDYWFTQFDFPNAEGKPYRASGGAMTHNDELGIDIPEGWEAVNLGSRLSYVRGVEPGRGKYLDEEGSDTVLFYRVKDLNSPCKTFVHKSEVTKAMATYGDIILSLDGTPGRLSYACHGGYSSGLRKVTDPQGTIPPSVIYCLLKSERVQQIIKKFSHGTNILHASAALEHMHVPFDEDTISKFGEITTLLYDEMVHLTEENEQLVKLRDYLLPLLMSGQVTVDSDDEEERTNENEENN